MLALKAYVIYTVAVHVESAPSMDVLPVDEAIVVVMVVMVVMVVTAEIKVEVLPADQNKFVISMDVG